MSTDKIKIEELHALADGELPPDQRDRVLAALEHDPESRAILNDIRHTKELVRHAYPLGSHQPQHQPNLFLRFGQVAAILLVMLTGFGIGWQSAMKTASTDEPVAGRNSTLPGARQPYKSIIYLGHSDHAKFRAALDKAHDLLSQGSGDDTEVYVVASAGGIDLMRKQTSPYQAEMIKLMSANRALRFVACNNTIYRFQQEGKPVDLVEGTDVAPSAVEFVVRHLRQGWNYVSI
jgi:intracellular sulfur oxidation DsrE/DsrF family protein